MFICTDCKAKYEAKPDYCDCGNNIFDEVIEKEIQASVEEKPAEEFYEKPFKSEKSQKTSFYDSYPEVKRFVDSVDRVSAGIFALCIVFSVLAWIFIGRGSSNTVQAPKSRVQKSQVQTQIPDLDSFWDNSKSTSAVDKKKPLEEEVKKNSEEQQEVSQETVQKPEPVKSIFQPVQKPEKVTPKLVKKDSTAKAKQSSQESLDSTMDHYKGSLRQALFSKLAVTSMQGEGSCVIEFSIDKSGKLVNRRFVKLSNNRSIDDAIYNMLMRTPAFYPPPTRYHGEKIRMSFSFNNGYYEMNY